MGLKPMKSFLTQDLFNSLIKFKVKVGMIEINSESFEWLNLFYTYLSKYYRRLLVLWKGTCAPKAQKPVTLP